MIDFDYDRWWLFHLRVARKEILSDQEQIEYLAGLSHLDSQADLPAPQTNLYLRTLRAAIERASMLHAELTAKSTELVACQS
jgi:hypothetical protein